jgi:hypothetical protein
VRLRESCCPEEPAGDFWWAGKNLTVKSFGAAPAKGTLEIPGSGKVTYDTKTRTFVQPVFIWRYDPTTKTVVPDAKPAS